MRKVGHDVAISRASGRIMVSFSSRYLYHSVALHSSTSFECMHRANTQNGNSRPVAFARVLERADVRRVSSLRHPGSARIGRTMENGGKFRLRPSGVCDFSHAHGRIHGTWGVVPMHVGCMWKQWRHAWAVTSQAALRDVWPQSAMLVRYREKR